jgi:hypothetical protein
MSPTIAYNVLIWLVIIALFCGYAALLREVRLLRGIVMRNPQGFTSAAPDITLGPRFADGQTRVVLAVDTGCPLCVAATERLSEHAPGSTILTHEDTARWNGLANGLDVVRDSESWRAIAHLSTPVLMRVAGDGRVTTMVLPTRLSEVDEAVTGWRADVADR